MREQGSTPVANKSALANQKTDTQLLATHLKEADPAMYEIIENASLPLVAAAAAAATTSLGEANMLTTLDIRTGEDKAKALHQPHPLRELHITGGARCPGQSNAKYEHLGTHEPDENLTHTCFYR